MLRIQKQTNKGFTLVELAIVLVIVGLLIGGILKGQQLMQNSRITATVAQIKAMEAATTNFYDVYGEKPGDLQNPVTRIKGCDNCDVSNNAAADPSELGNGKVGPKDWSLDFVADPYQGANWLEAAHAETVLFWYELQQAGLISAVTSEGVDDTETSTTITFGGTLPAAKAGGGFWVGNLSGKMDNPTVRTAAQAIVFFGKPEQFGLRGTVLRWVAIPNTDDRAPPIVPQDVGLQPLVPAQAANVDRKLDDGLPNSGNVEAYGVDEADPAGCMDGPDDGSSDDVYLENVNSKDCGLVIRIFK